MPLYGCVGRGRVRLVTSGRNLLRQCAAKAQFAINKLGRTQPGALAKTAGRSIKRMVQLRDIRPDSNSWESLVEG